ncbi:MULTISPECIES: aminoglycoside phosphotransferase family protein [Legionella]|uniref:Phosphotransferase n=1 Tax=Legionella septentrionalis TaxID=2498109 RepID=A0A3S0V9S4_9GAMM|nr:MULTISPECIES: phosphotransferase [Legionella]MCP0913791.1 phosphotransferase [Legionella sp. 27cVA30]RUQ81591.1 phosphotransferase [Legionella septentrionalis]RUQ96429.1 phosphotransferase [Legionella septentrionalis]RUR09674.1 phosphotransferase [Legionella septentrionalis]
MHARQSALNNWLKRILGTGTFTLTTLAGDASFRRYYRLFHENRSYVVMDAPPEKENILPFMQIGNALRNQGIHTPYQYAADSEQGFILLEDLGDQLLLSVLTADSVNALYQSAMQLLLRLQQCPVATPQLPSFDKSFMLQELHLFRQWFLSLYLDLHLTLAEEEIITACFATLSEDIAKQPRVFIHRDYHSRNLILTGDIKNPDLGVIDFQDAMQGPFTYDLVSLLKDCYIQWPREQILNWVQFFYQKLPEVQTWTLAEFIKAFDFCGLQRHLKVLGVFSRLHLRDHKSGYLQDLPLTFNYVMACLESYPQFLPFYHLMQQKIFPSFIEKQPQ